MIRITIETKEKLKTQKFNSYVVEVSSVTATFT